MKWKSSIITRLSGSMRPGKDAELVTARQLFGGQSSIGLGTVAAYRMDPKQRLQRLHYTMACAKWGTLSPEDKEEYEPWASDNDVTVFSSFLHSYLGTLQNNLRLYLPMDALINSTVTDYSKYNNDGTNDGAVLIPDGFIYKALDFNGINNSVNCGSDVSLSPTDEITIAAWIKAAPENQGTILKKWVWTGQYGYHFDLSGQDLQIVLGYGDETRIVVISDFSAYYDTWAHVVATGNSERLKEFINGKFVNESTPTKPFALSNDRNLEVGTASDFSGLYFEGVIDEVRLYAQGLTAAEILRAYRQESLWHKHLD